jgi:ketosteroid isomerase-like protein
VSEQNVDLLRRVAEAYNARDVEAFTAYFDPSVELYSEMTTPGGSLYRGHEGIRQLFRDLEDGWQEIRGEPESFFDLGDQTLVFYEARGRGRKSGAEVSMSVALMAEWRDELIVYFKTYRDRKDALAELGVSEDELEPIAP